MKRYLPIIVLFIFKILSAQEKQPTYLEFDAKSEQLCEVSKNDTGRYHSTEKTKKYVKIKSNSKEHLYRFYICKDLFLFSKKERVDTFNIANLKDIKISKIEDLKKEVNKINILYPYKVFPNLYIIEKIDDTTYVSYKVKWKYYIK